MATFGQTAVQKYQNLLKKSPTAYSPGVKPTKSDISAQIALLRAQKGEQATETETLKKQWYSGDSPTGEAKTGYLRGFLRTMAAPGSAVVGALETALGKGTKKGLAQNIVANVKEGGTAGDLLRNLGVPNTVSMPLGLALDIALDPVNWATMGTSAFIPRLFAGAAAGVKTGAGLFKVLGIAAKSGALMKAEKFGRVLPGLMKATFEKNIPTGLPGLYRKVSQKAVKSRLGWEELTGESVEKMLNKSASTVPLLTRWSQKMRESESGTVRELERVFGGKSDEWFKNALIADEKAAGEMAKLSGAGTLLSKEDEARGTVDIFLDAALNKRKMPVADSVERQLTEAVILADNPNLARSKNSLESFWRLQGEAKENVIFKKDLKDAVEKVLSPEELQKASLHEIYDSGIKTADAILAKVIDSPKGRWTLSNYNRFIGLFKNMKIGGNLLGTGTSAVVSNLAATGMAGIRTGTTGFWGSAKKAVSIIRGKDFSALKELTDDPRIIEALTKHGDTFRAITGLNPEFILRGRSYLDSVVGELVPKLAGGDSSKMAKLFEDAEKVTNMLVPPQLKKAAKKAFSTVEAAREGVQTTFLSSEIFSGPYFESLNKLKKMAEETGNPLYRGIHWALTGSMEAYNKIDQTYRLTNFLNLVKSGIDETELKLLARRFQIGTDDAIQIPGRNMWKLSPVKALEISQDIYMNYLAMPAFVKFMRQLPILGSPFFSFTYGAMGLTAKTLAYNPSFFNKVQYLLHEISGEKSPLEKEALSGQYYRWLDKEGMMKLPFFKENPVYLNVENMLPYYTLNFFQPQERTYGDRFGDTVAAIIDKSPFFKEPVGQILMDYVILPSMLSEAKGMFGQPLWSNDASVLEKVGRTAQAAVETLTPPMAGFAGPLVPQSVLPYMPFRVRQSGFAAHGKSSLGIPTQEPAFEHTARVMGAIAGWPTYKIKLRNQ